MAWIRSRSKASWSGLRPRMRRTYGSFVGSQTSTDGSSVTLAGSANRWTDSQATHPGFGVKRNRRRLTRSSNASVLVLSWPSMTQIARPASRSTPQDLLPARFCLRRGRTASSTPSRFIQSLCQMRSGTTKSTTKRCSRSSVHCRPGVSTSKDFRHSSKSSPITRTSSTGARPRT